jgi:hypothetical protein
MNSLNETVGQELRKERMVDTICNAPSRMTSRGILLQMIDRKGKELRDLEALAKALPVELPSMADEALWKLLTQH